MTPRRKTRPVKAGGLTIGGGSDIAVQSMTNTDTRDVRATVEQIIRLEKAGCEMVRVAVPDSAAASKIGAIKKRISIPLVADIHFDYRLALEAIRQGADKLRINPGNIGGRDKVREIVRAARDRQIPIRIGVNAGSLEKDLLRRSGGHPTSGAMVESALKHIELMEDMDFKEIVVSLKSSDVLLTVEAYRSLAQRVDYPLHLGLTEAGSFLPGTIRSSVALGILLSEGIGDTIRISLTGPPEQEIRPAFLILQSLGLRNYGPSVISCPTCGRCGIDLNALTKKVEEMVSGISKPMRIAVMGCAVNGPGEAREADLGIAGGKGEGLLFSRGSVIRRVPEKELLSAFKAELARCLAEDYGGKHE
ncbi:MAG: flavodoxin-dependent (E)-4-hydroxy-3-methylbut-2-enyl-diphosphate synthase [Bacillota bacterium]